MKNLGKIWLVVAVLFLCAYPALGVHFRDGLNHYIDYFIDEEDVYVDYQAPNMYTTVNWLDGALIREHDYVYGYGNSTINVRGGRIDGLISCDSSRVNISGGSMYLGIESYDSSQVNMSGGEIYYGISCSDSSQVNMSGGETGFLISYGSSRVNITGGITWRLMSDGSNWVNISGGETYNLDSYGSNQVNISGGEIYGLISYDSSRVNISGGEIYGLSSYNSGRVNISGGYIGDFHSAGSSKVNIYGGYIGDFHSAGSSKVDISGGYVSSGLVLSDQSKIYILGSDFVVDDQPFGYGELTSIYGGNPWDEPFRYLIGTLLSGELFYSDFYIGHDAKIILTIPEPASVILLGLGGLAIRKRK